MGRPFLIEYDQTPSENFFLCRLCRTHIALTQEFVFNDPMANVGIFNNAVNVEIDGPAHYHREAVTGNTVADVHCKTCNCLLGKKFGKALDVGGNSDAVCRHLRTS